MAESQSNLGETAILVGIPSDKMAVLDEILQGNGIETIKVSDGSAALRQSKRNLPSYLLAWRDLPFTSGLKLIQTYKRRHPRVLAAVVGPQISAEARRSIVRQGADDYIEIDSGPGHIETIIRRLVVRKRTGIIGRNERMLQAVEIIESIARTKVTVLVTGESGTGKELIARAIHKRSNRQAGPFIAVNCGALPEGVLESELFGHEKGSFTGAVTQRKGIFELADKGTLLLDEVGEMPLGIQVKLLRVLEEECFMRVGGTRDVHVDVRVIASTNRNLKHLVEEGSFRRDLFYRLNVVTIDLPPLRERREDIQTIFLAFVEDFCKENDIEFGGISDDALVALENYDWPGNVRELRNVAESLAILSRGRRITLEDLPEHILRRETEHPDLPVRVGRPRWEVERDLLFGRLAAIEERIAYLTNVILNATGNTHSVPVSAPYNPVHAEEVKSGESLLHDEIVVRPGTPLKQVERELIESTLRKVKGNRKRAAQLLGIGERTLYRRMKEYNLT